MKLRNILKSALAAYSSTFVSDPKILMIECEKRRKLCFAPSNIVMIKSRNIRWRNM